MHPAKPVGAVLPAGSLRLVKETRDDGVYGHFHLKERDGKNWDVTQEMTRHLGLRDPLVLHRRDTPYISQWVRDGERYLNGLQNEKLNAARITGDYSAVSQRISAGEELTAHVLSVVFRTAFPTALPHWLVVAGKYRELDGFSAESGIALEYQGAHHDEPATIAIDIQKRAKCVENDVKLLQVQHVNRAVGHYVGEQRPGQKSAKYDRLMSELVMNINTAIKGHAGVPWVTLTLPQLDKIRERLDTVLAHTARHAAEMAPRPPMPRGGIATR